MDCRERFLDPRGGRSDTGPAPPPSDRKVGPGMSFTYRSFGSPLQETITVNRATVEFVLQALQRADLGLMQAADLQRKAADWMEDCCGVSIDIRTDVRATR